MYHYRQFNMQLWPDKTTFSPQAEIEMAEGPTTSGLSHIYQGEVQGKEPSDKINMYNCFNL